MSETRDVEGGAAAHVHAWSQLHFELVEEHPVAAQTCMSCSVERRYRAWERYWDPGEPERASSPPC
ncbi:MAG: hypothetical protein ABIR11_10175 [Candidatus Limnocylindrales bacterium]